MNDRWAYPEGDAWTPERVKQVYGSTTINIPEKTAVSYLCVECDRFFVVDAAKPRSILYCEACCVEFDRYEKSAQTLMWEVRP